MHIFHLFLFFFFSKEEKKKKNYWLFVLRWRRLPRRPRATARTRFLATPTRCSQTLELHDSPTEPKRRPKRLGKLVSLMESNRLGSQKQALPRMHACNEPSRKATRSCLARSAAMRRLFVYLYYLFVDKKLKWDVLFFKRKNKQNKTTHRCNAKLYGDSRTWFSNSIIWRSSSTTSASSSAST